MSAPATVDSFLEAVRKSGLLSSEQIELELSRHAASANGSLETRLLAANMVRSGLLTNFQAQQLLHGRSKHFILGEYRVLEPIRSASPVRLFLAEHSVTMQRVTIETLSGIGSEPQWRVVSQPIDVTSPTPPPNEIQTAMHPVAVKLTRARPRLVSGSPTPIPKPMIVAAPNPQPRRASRWTLLAAFVLLVASVVIAATW